MSRCCTMTTPPGRPGTRSLPYNSTLNLGSAHGGNIRIPHRVAVVARNRIAAVGYGVHLSPSRRRILPRFPEISGDWALMSAEWDRERRSECHK